MDIAVYVVDTHTKRFIDVNNCAVQTLGYSRSEFLSLGPRNIEVLKHDHIVHKWPERLARLRAATSVTSEGRHRRKDGSEFPVEVNASIHCFEGREFILAVCKNLTDQKEAETNRLIKERLASVVDFASGIAHDINNPLSYTMANMVYVLRTLSEDGPLDDAIRQDLKEALQEALDGSERIKKSVSELQRFSEVSHTQNVPVVLIPVVEQALSDTMGAIRSRANLVRDFSPVPMVMGQSKKLTGAIACLLLNAAQAIGPPCDDPDTQVIKVSTYLKGPDTVCVEVSDSGCGISAEDLPKIFDPFFTTRPRTGLGLTFAHRTITAMGGLIAVESTAGVGSNFVVMLSVAGTAPVPG